MSSTRTRAPQEALDLLERFRRGDDPQRRFEYPTCHPSQPTGFCPCDRPFHFAIGFYLKAALLQLVLNLPFNRLSCWLLRRMGARIGDNVFLSAGVWIDPMFPDLLTIEDNVLLGSGVRIGFHEFRRDRFVAGRVIIRRGAIVGGFSLIGPGVEIGEDATVAGGAVIGRDVPARSVAGGNPARVVSA